MSKPKIFSNNSDGYIIQQEIAFEELCAVLEEHGAHNPKGMTVYEFMARTVYCEKKFKTQTENNGR